MKTIKDNLLLFTSLSSIILSVLVLIMGIRFSRELEEISNEREIITVTAVNDLKNDAVREFKDRMINEFLMELQKMQQKVDILWNDSTNSLNELDDLDDKNSFCGQYYMYISATNKIDKNLKK